MKHALLITNLNARSVSERVKRVIVKALSADLKLEVQDTKARNHATELAADAADRGLDLVISFGGDGTMNEVVNGLAGSETVLGLLPGGMANVFCRTLGMPVDIVEATGVMLTGLRDFRTRPINIGKIEDRYFVMSCGVGIDAATVRRTEANPVAKRKYKHWFFLSSAFKTAFTEFRRVDPFITMKSGESRDRVVFAVVSNIPTFTYFKNMPITVTPDAKLDEGLDVFAMRKFTMPYIPRLLWSAFHSGSHVRYKHSAYWTDLSEISITADDDRTFAVQVDGEYLGERSEVNVTSVTDAIKVLT